ncbi:Calmodulin-binding domain [Heracleum sosnowskyi]|uniref:Calmodulin-binding domain n=1 Tax=Heracleum sosnowskyi TaxID=360622 RepID=A0AAD8IFL4_9APIA|nr:Calmodulin-binding domain [Heracleum sosnowskyi]
MAEEKNDMQLSPEITKLDKTNPRRNSTGIVKRSSTAKSSSQNYLRASTGSCHDFCKYGRQQTFAVQARNPKPKKMTPSPGKKKQTEREVVAQKSKPSASKLKPSSVKVQSSKQNSGNAVQGESNKISKVKLKPSSVDTAHSPEPPEIIKREIILPSKQLDVSPKQNSSETKIKMDKKMKTTPLKYSSGPKSKPLMVKPSPSSTTSVGTNGAKKTSSKPEKVIGTSKTIVKKLPAAPTASLSPKTSNSRSVNLYARKHSSANLVSPLKDQKRTQKIKSKPDTEKVQEKTLHAVEADTDDKVIISSSPSLQSPSLSLPDSQFSASYEDVAEDSKYIDKDIQQSECTDSEDLEESEYTESEVDGFISGDDETVNINEVSKLNGENNQCVKVARVIRSGDKDGAMARSTFRKGRTVDLQIVHNVPRRLKFRRGRILGDNDDKHAARRSFEKRELDNDSNGASPGSEKVVLRHQDMQGKKDAQGLYNNVIEETASKLVESRKSKVKALVGAFETVISLQESKPSIPTVT